MKKFLALLLAMLLVVSMAACGGDSDQEQNKAPTEAAEAEEAPAEAEEAPAEVEEAPAEAEEAPAETEEIGNGLGGGIGGENETEIIP